jgi:hypothetical protein
MADRIFPAGHNTGGYLSALPQSRCKSTAGSADFLEVEGREVHLSGGEDVDGEDALALGKVEFGEAGAMFQWCHCRQATGSAALQVVAMVNGPVVGGT